MFFIYLKLLIFLYGGEHKVSNNVMNVRWMLEVLLVEEGLIFLLKFVDLADS